ncbi:MAG: Ig-like domain-containing protein, partial [Caulobacter sp.]|nr:Ig-like domain-containing protein [Caulobacter sp.]
MSPKSKVVSPKSPELPPSTEEGRLISLAVSDPVAANDTAKASEDGSASLTPLSNDTDPLSGTLVIGLINGLAVSAGDVVTLASGARVTVEADGSLTYDTNGVFAGLNDGETVIETFTYQAVVPGAAT